MSAIMDEFDYGNFRFIVEVDAGFAPGVQQATLWAAEKVDVDTLPLSHFTLPQLLHALPSTHKRSLVARYESLQFICRNCFEEEIEDLVRFCSKRTGRRKKRRYEEAKHTIRFIRGQIQLELQQSEKEFIEEEIIVLERRVFDRALLQEVCEEFHPVRYIRDFYFEEQDISYIREFCKRYALDAAFRAQAQSGEMHWAKRNTLFLRNLPALLVEAADELERMRIARDFFAWIDAHCEEILELPAYRLLKELDSACKLCTSMNDPLIQPAVEALNRLPGVVARFSCQGVSGTVRVQGRDILTVSPHEKYAYISFTTLGQYAHDRIILLLPQFPAITASRKHGIITLRSSGDNVRFREEILALAQHLLELVDDAWRSAPAEPGDLEGRFVEHSVPLPANAKLPAGLLPTRLEWLCQPGQIEDTLRLVYHLSCLSQERDFLEDDQEGLLQLKTALVRKAFENGLVEPLTYIDASQHFAHDFYPGQAADIAAASFINRLEALFDHEQLVPDAVQIDPSALALFSHISGYQLTTASDLHAIDERRIFTYIQSALEAVIEQACITREPITLSALEALCIQPIDLLDLQTSHLEDAPGWRTIVHRDLYRLDPEGRSQIAFRYRSPTAEYCFHLPYRIAETFVPEAAMSQLRIHPCNNVEQGEHQGAKLSNHPPLKQVLKELGVDVASICPHNLVPNVDGTGHRRRYRL